MPHNGPTPRILVPQKVDQAKLGKCNPISPSADGTQYFLRFSVAAAPGAGASRESSRLSWPGFFFKLSRAVGLVPLSRAKPSQSKSRLSPARLQLSLSSRLNCYLHMRVVSSVVSKIGSLSLCWLLAHPSMSGLPSGPSFTWSQLDPQVGLLITPTPSKPNRPLLPWPTLSLGPGKINDSGAGTTCNIVCTRLLHLHRCSAITHQI